MCYCIILFIQLNQDRRLIDGKIDSESVINLNLYYHTHLFTLYLFPLSETLHRL